MTNTLTLPSIHTSPSPQNTPHLTLPSIHTSSAAWSSSTPTASSSLNPPEGKSSTASDTRGWENDRKIPKGWENDREKSQKGEKMTGKIPKGRENDRENPKGVRKWIIQRRNTPTDRNHWHSAAVATPWVSDDGSARSRFCDKIQQKNVFGDAQHVCHLKIRTTTIIQQ